VIALTASMDPHQLERLRDLGVSEVMTKAKFTVEQLLDCVRTHAGKPREGQPAPGARNPVPSPRTRGRGLG
jgi:CheY-like chemotaxis protein